SAPGLSWLTATTQELVPLWQYRFRGASPYATVQVRRNNEVQFVGEGVVSNAAPPANKYGTGTQIAFLGRGFPAPRAVVLEHPRRRVAEAFTGLLQLEGDADAEPPRPQENRPRARVPAYDLALQTPVDDDDQYYVIVGYSKSREGNDALKINRVVAYD